jgi:hypothetical protein
MLSHPTRRRTGRSVALRTVLRSTLALVGLLVLAGLLAVTPGIAATSCTKVAAPSGSDSGAGADASPYRTAQKLVDSLDPGQVGCLRAGRYGGDVNVHRSGSAGSPITLSSYPGQRATIAARLTVSDSANFITIEGLNLSRPPQSTRTPSVDIHGDDVVLRGNDITDNRTAICVSLGATTYGRAARTVVEGNRVHDCGGSMPNHDHGIYVEHADGAQILSNIFYDNADRGVQLYPDAQGTRVAHNIIDGNGEGVLVAGGTEDYGCQASSGNVVEENVITNSHVRANVESFWGCGKVGSGNVVRSNCVWPATLSVSSLTNRGNVFADPLYANRGAKDFTLRAGSPCAGLLRGFSATRTPRKQARARRAVVLHAPSHKLWTGGKLRLHGKVLGKANAKLRVRIMVRAGRHWRRLRGKWVNSDGKFATRSRLSHRGHGRGAFGRRPLMLKRLRLPRGTHVFRVRAVVPAVGRSNILRVRIH